jgi:hypothetical protein
LGDAAVRADTRWSNLNTAFGSYLAYIAKKRPRLSLSFVDLLYVSNFKGGNASIIDPSLEVNNRLKRYSIELKQVRKAGLQAKRLGELTNVQLVTFVDLANTFIHLPFKSDTRIRGFRASYASALFAAHFPDLAPVLDRNVLLGAGIDHQVDSQKQVIQIETHYGDLIRHLHSLQRDNRQSLRQIDRALFISGSGGKTNKC